jgi:SAM-dependent methyltransferase
MAQDVTAVRRHQEDSLESYLATHAGDHDRRLTVLSRRLFPFFEREGILRPGDRILDLGCGTGWLSEMARRRGYDVVAADIQPAEAVHARFPELHYQYFDIFEPPVGIGCFDFVFCRALGPLGVLDDWTDIPIFDWLAAHLSDRGVMYFELAVLESNGCLTPPYVRERFSQVAPQMWMNVLPENLTVVHGCVSVEWTEQLPRSRSSHVLNVWGGHRAR